MFTTVDVNNKTAYSIYSCSQLITSRVNRITVEYFRFTALSYKRLLREQNTQEIMAVNEPLYVIKHTYIIAKFLPRFSRLIQQLC